MIVLQLRIVAQCRRHIGKKVDRPGERAGINHIIDLRCEFAVIDFSQYRGQNFIAETVDIGFGVRAPPIDIHHIRGRNLPQLQKWLAIVRESASAEFTTSNTFSGPPPAQTGRTTASTPPAAN